MNKNILGIYESSTPDEIKNGSSWFENARNLCLEISEDYNVNYKKVAAVISALSPACKWTQNIIDAKNLINGWENAVEHKVKVGTYNLNKVKAISILNDDDFNEFPSNGRDLKTYCFYHNIVDASSDRVTIDRHASKVYYGAKYAGSTVIRGKKYLMIESSFAKTAKHIGIKPYQLQAITWLTYKRLMNR